MVTMTDPRKYHVSIKVMFVFFVALLLCIYIPRYLIEGSFELGANVNYAEQNPHYFSVSWSKFLQIVCLGPFFGIIYFLLLKVLLSKVDHDLKKNRMLSLAIEVSAIVLIALNSMGHVLHLGFEGVNAIDATKGEALGNEFEEMFVYAWYMDEWLGHSLIHSTYFGYLVLAVLGEGLLAEHSRIHWDEGIYVLIGAVGVAIVDAWAAIRSESGVLLLTFHLIYSIIALAFILVKKTDPLSRPILLGMLVGTIFVVIYNIHYVLTNGFSPIYPFY